MRFIKPAKGGVELPTLTTPGSASDLANGKELIDGSGAIVTGSVYTVDPYNAVPASSELVIADGAAQMEYTFTDADGSVLFRPGSALGLHCDAADLGNAASSDVANGKTFTSVNGKSLVGTLAEVPAGEVVLKTVTKTIENGTSIQQSAPVSADTLLRAGAIMRLSMPNASYGDATAADVAAGKTFTGADGYKKTGTAAGGLDLSNPKIFGDMGYTQYNNPVTRTYYIDPNKTYVIFAYYGLGGGDKHAAVWIIKDQQKIVPNSDEVDIETIYGGSIISSTWLEIGTLYDDEAEDENKAGKLEISINFPAASSSGKRPTYVSLLMALD